MKRSFIFLLIIIVLVFISFTLPKFVAQKLPTGDKEYTLQTPGMNVRNRPPLFKRIDNAVYFVHPSSAAPAKGEFIIKKGGGNTGSSFLSKRVLKLEIYYSQSKRMVRRKIDL